MPRTPTENDRRYRERHPERVREQRKRYRASEKYKETQRLHHQRRKEDGRSWEAGLRFRYGITGNDYKRMLQEQCGSCKLCGTPPKPDKKLGVDHVHDETKAVRGLLCDDCNKALGCFKDDPELLMRAAEYVRTGGFISGT